MKFENEARSVTRSDYYRKSQYGFDRAPRLLFLWSRLFQSVISQAGTYLLTGKFHDSHCAIFKSEGGCRIDGVGDLVLIANVCYLDYPSGKPDEKRECKLADLITKVVLGWNPNDPIYTMLIAAAEHIGVEVSKLQEAVAKSDNGNPFSGNALADFFNWNPFSEPPIDRKYERWCLVNFGSYTEAEVTQKHADEDLGKALLAKINKAIAERHGESFYGRALCCSPSRTNGELKFWINTGRGTQIDYWKTQKEIEQFLASDEKLVDRATK